MRVECTYMYLPTLPDLGLIKQLPRKTREGKRRQEVGRESLHVSIAPSGDLPPSAPDTYLRGLSHTLSSRSVGVDHLRCAFMCPPYLIHPQHRLILLSQTLAPHEASPFPGSVHVVVVVPRSDQVGKVQ